MTKMKGVAGTIFPDQSHTVDEDGWIDLEEALGKEAKQIPKETALGARIRESKDEKHVPLLHVSSLEHLNGGDRDAANLKEDGRLASIPQMAKAADVSESTVLQLIQRGEFKPRKIYPGGYNFTGLEFTNCFSGRSIEMHGRQTRFLKKGNRKPGESDK